MDSDKDEKIRRRAYEIWQREGSPEGRSDEHWSQAARELEDEDGSSDESGAGLKVTTADDPTRGSGSGGRAGSAGGEGGSSSSGSPSNPGSGGRGAPGGAGVSSGLQPGGAKPGGGPAAMQGGVGTGGGSTAGRASGSAAGGKE